MDAPPDPDGRHRQVTKTFDKESEARKWARGEEAKRDRGDAVPPDRCTVADLCADWLAEKEGHVRPKTHADYAAQVNGKVAPKLGAVRVQALTKQQGSRWLADLRRAKTGARSVQVAKLRLDQILDLAVAWRLAPRNVARAIATPPAPAAERAVWSPEQLRAFLAEAARDALHPLWHVAAATGLRRGELLGLRWTDVDLEAGELRVAQTVVPVPGGLSIGPPKTAAARRPVALPAAVVRLLRDHRDRQAFARARAGDLWLPDFDLVFCTRTGTPLNPNNVYPNLYAAVKRAKVPRIALNDVRHTHVTHALAAGEQVGVVSRRIGHARTSVTLDVYGHVLEGQDRGLADRLDAFFAAPPESENTGS